MTPYFERGGITIYHGDALEVLNALPDILNKELGSGAGVHQQHDLHRGGALFDP